MEKVFGDKSKEPQVERSTMKVKKAGKKAATAPPLAERVAADEFGTSYFVLKEQLDVLNMQNEGLKEKIRTFATKSATAIKEGQSTVVYGKKYKVGYLTTKVPMGLDYKRLF